MEGKSLHVLAAAAAAVKYLPRRRRGKPKDVLRVLPGRAALEPQSVRTVGRNGGGGGAGDETEINKISVDEKIKSSVRNYY